jgi:hypothetical protein
MEGADSNEIDLSPPLAELASQFVIIQEDAEFDARGQVKQGDPKQAALNAEKLLNGAFSVTERQVKNIIINNDLRLHPDTPTQNLTFEELIIMVSLGKEVNWKGKKLTEDEVKTHLGEATERKISVLENPTRIGEPLVQQQVTKLREFKKQIPNASFPPPPKKIGSTSE